MASATLPQKIEAKSSTSKASVRSGVLFLAEGIIVSTALVILGTSHAPSLAKWTSGVVLATFVVFVMRIIWSAREDAARFRNVTWLWFGLLSILAAFAAAAGQLPLAIGLIPAGIFLVARWAPGYVWSQTLKMVQQGRCNRALQIMQWSKWLPWKTHRAIRLEGYLLFRAGRFTEAKDVLRIYAMDQSGRLRLTSWDFVTYAYSIFLEGDEHAAQEMFERAVLLPQSDSAAHLSLADLLLSQKKDAVRAERFIASALEKWPLTGFRKSHVIAMQAWAFAESNRPGYARAKLDEALENLAGRSTYEKATLLNIAGQTYASLKETAEARNAFMEVLNIHPEGTPAIIARKHLKNPSCSD